MNKRIKEERLGDELGWGDEWSLMNLSICPWTRNRDRETMSMRDNQYTIDKLTLLHIVVSINPPCFWR